MLTWVDLNELGMQQARLEMSEADRRRAIVTLYYGYFHRPCSEAVLPFARGGPSLIAQASRAISHTPMRSVCETYGKGGSKAGSMPAWFRIVPTPVPGEIVGIAETFVELQEARVSADYDLSANIDRLDCFEARLIAEKGHNLIDTAKDSPDMTVFLTALLLADRWTRRG